MDKVLLVFLGGGLGSILRFALQHWLNAPPDAGGRHAWPWGTLLANTLGCLAAGAIAGLASSRLALDDHARILISAGFLGGFTTFSAFAGETIQLGGWRAIIYIALSNALGAGAALGMYALVRALTSDVFPVER